MIIAQGQLGKIVLKTPSSKKKKWAQGVAHAVKSGITEFKSQSHTPKKKSLKGVSLSNPKGMLGVVVMILEMPSEHFYKVLLQINLLTLKHTNLYSKHPLTATLRMLLSSTKGKF
jgi:hypothetical protein